MRRSIFALAGVAVLAALAAFAFGVLAEGGGKVQAQPNPQSFTFCSGSADPPTFDPNKGGPTTSGLGAFGARDPVTDHVGTLPSVGPLVTFPGDPGDAVIIAQNPGWGLVPGSQWVSYGETTTSGPPNSSVVTFTVDFVTVAVTSNIEVTTIQDDRVVISVDTSASFIHAGHTLASLKTTPKIGIFGTDHVLRFDVAQLGGDGFGLDYCATVTPGAVGGITELVVGGSDAPASAADGSGSSVPYGALAAAAAVAAIGVAGGGWYARRRWLR